MANNIEDRKHLVHIHSSVRDKEPTGKAAQSMLVGELAVNNNAGYEFISTKNTNGEMARFSSDEVIDRKIMFDSGTGENAVVQRGGENAAEGENSLALNKGTATLNEAETASGRYNKPSKSSEVFGDSGNTLFTVGNGLSEYDRNNAFMVMQNGDAIIEGKAKADSIETVSGPNVFHGDTFIESADTLYNVNDIIDGLNEAISDSTDALSAAIDTLSAETFEAIDDLSAETFQAIENLSAETFQTIDELSAATFNDFRFEPDSSAAPEDTVKVTFVSNDGTETSHYMQYDTELSSGSVNAVENKVIKKTVDEIYDTIEHLSDDTDAKIEFLSGTIDDLSAETFDTIDSLSATTNQKLEELSAATEDAIEALSAETFETIDELSAKTFSSLDIDLESSAEPENSVKFTLNRYGEEPEIDYLKFDTLLSSGSVNAVQNKVIKATVDDIYDAIAHQADDTDAKIQFLSGTIDDFSAETFDTIDELSAKTVSGITLTPRSSAAPENAIDVRLHAIDGSEVYQTYLQFDTQLSDDSVNAVENRIIKGEVDKIYETIESASTDLEEALEQLSAKTFHDFAFAPNSSANPEDAIKVTVTSNDGTETSHFIQLDSELSSGSVNGVQNKVITAAIEALDSDTRDEIDAIKERLDKEEEKSDIFSGDIADLKADSFASAEYDSSAKTIYFYNKAGEELDSIDATAFIKDGMVYSAYIESDDLVIVFNTDAGGKEDIHIPLVQIFNPENYYDKQAVDEIVSGIKSTAIIAGDGLVGGGALSADVEVSLEVLESQGTYIKNVVDKFGRVTSGSATITSDDVLVSGDTLTQVMTDNEEVVSAALNDLNARIIANSGAIATIISQEGVSEEKIREINGRLDDHQERIGNLEGRMTAAERNILANSGAIADNAIAISANADNIEIISGDLQSTKNQVEINRLDIIDLKERADQSYSGLTDLEERVAAEEGRSEVFSAAIDDLSSRMSSAETAIQDIIEEGVVGDKAFKELSGKVDDMSAIVETMSDNLDTVSGDVKDLEARVKAEEDRSEVFSASVDTLFGTTEALRDDVDSVSGQIVSLSAIVRDDELTISAALNDLNVRISGMNPSQIVSTKLESSIFYEYTANTQPIIEGKADQGQVDGIKDRVEALESATSDIDVMSGDVAQNTTNITIISGDVEQAKDDIEAVSGVVGQNSVNIETISGLAVDNKTNIETVSGKADQNATDIAALSGAIDTVDAKIPDVTHYIDNVVYDEANQLIKFNHGDTLIDSINASGFVKDGMISSAYVESNNLVIVFNTDAGQEAIEVPIGDIFDADNYYTKVQTDALISGVTNWVEEQHYLTEHQSLSAYSTTSEIDGMIISATSDKANKTTTINAGTGLDGGGNLMGDITISLEPTGTAGEYFKVKTDNYGRVTSGSNTISADDIMVTPVSSLTDCIIENELIVSAALNDLKLATVSGSSEEARYAAQLANAAADRAFSAASAADETWSSVNADIATLFEQDAQETAERKDADNDLMLKISQLLTRVEVLESLQADVETVSTPEDIAEITNPSTTNVIVTSDEALASMTAGTTYKTVTVVGADLDSMATLKAEDKVIVDGMTVNGGKSAQGNGKVNLSAPVVELKNVTVASGSSAYNIFEGSQVTATTDAFLDKMEVSNVTVDNTQLQHNVVNVYTPANDAVITIKDSYFNMNAENSNVVRISNYGNSTGVSITFENIDWTYDSAEVSSYEYAGLLLYQVAGSDNAKTGDTSAIATWTVKFKNCTYNGVKVNSNNFGTKKQVFYAYGINGGTTSDPSLIEGLTIIFE